MIAATILQQIGGKRFAAMTGSRDFMDLGDGVRMNLSRNKTSANRLTIGTLDNIFDDPEAWGVASLKEWIDSYESSRFTQTDERTAGHNLRIQHDPCKGVVGAAYAH